MSPVTELVALPITDASAISEAVRKSFSIVARQPGFQRAFWGTQIENPGKANIWIEWDSLDSHTAFINSPDFQPSGAALGSILAGAPSLFHARFSSKPSEALVTSPALEIATLFSPTQELGHNIEKFLSILGKCAGFRGCAFGPIVEEIAPDDKTEKEKAFIVVIGWESVDAHVQAVQTPEAAEAAPLLLASSRKFEAHHTQFEVFKPDLVE